MTTNRWVAFILAGSITGYIIYRYIKLPRERKTEIINGIKKSFINLKDDAAGVVNNVKDVLDDTADEAKEHFPAIGRHMENFLKEQVPNQVSKHPTTEVNPGA